MVKILLFILLFLSQKYVYSQDKYSINEFSSTMQEYFIQPSLEKLSKLLYTYYEENAINQKQSAQMSIMGFFCVAFSDIKSDTNLKNDIEKKYSNNEIIFQSYELSKDIGSLLLTEDHSAGINDFFWGAFFASGDKKYIKKIASELAYINEKDSLNFYLAASSAKWSLCSNARQYKLVREHLLELKDSEPLLISQQIENILSSEPSEIKEEMILYLKENKNRFSK